MAQKPNLDALSCLPAREKIQHPPRVIRHPDAKRRKGRAFARVTSAGVVRP